MKKQFLTAFSVFAFTAAAHGQQAPLKIGVVADMSGMYSDMTGTGSVEAVKLAVQDFGGKLNGRSIEVVSADHQNKGDIASSLVRKWFDADGVDVVVNAAGSAVALAVVAIAKNANKTALITGAVTDRLSNEACTPNSVHYGIDNHALVVGTVDALLAQGKKKFFFIVADYAFGHSFLAQARPYIEAHGGQVVGSVRHPLNSADMSSFLLQAQASGADVIALANAGSDTINSVSQAGEFGMTQGKQSVAAMVMFLTDVHSLGLEKSQGLLLTTPSYWNLNDETRAFSQRFNKVVGRMPTFYQQADYSATLAYLKAAEKVGTQDGAKVVAEMKGKPINDGFAQGGMIREDGLLVHDVYLARVKKPSESKAPWDYYDIVAKIPGDKAFRQLDKSECPLVKK
ncbi:ABC transporter substrate-binding protein [Bosea sp. 685]|uniref:ABC transporter substrate-binding protein n=1 Tax=Bosea sp. 685 TaxID=3080057 RepID=UPI0028931A52|nr:ABC transporter substrate-binding protein [Bosea sp. 685]WNJ88808.1 ABC transporter substrate-binding protein [Bosea sp. 685]